MGERPYVVVTGGTGYIGSHTVVELLERFNVVIIDNLYNSSSYALDRIEEICGKRPDFHPIDLKDFSALFSILNFYQKRYSVLAVIHFAALKAVGESVKIPLDYYENNVGGTINLIKAMNCVGLKKMIFSSSATVYGNPSIIPIPETLERNPTSPYGKTKMMIEDIIKDVCASDSNWRAVVLRYFNPAGAHPSGRLGEDPRGTPNNLMPFTAQVAVGRREKVEVFGTDFETPDGTGLRDYIHVVDLSIGHVAALKKLSLSDNENFSVYNLGTGKATSVIEMIHTMSNVVGKPIPFECTDRRAGDVPILQASASKANTELSWQATRGLKEMCEDLWRWQSNNPQGFGDQIEQ